MQCIKLERTQGQDRLENEVEMARVRASPCESIKMKGIHRLAFATR